ncbi:hypothetical protein BDW59DRAFT_162000 [Aspergillus cavernicola]|uniref:Uncharacterized protein n=1 Tax=Aspergillus cavernicola TaxID=176166 RepID=A0ABR4IBC0_9EURO
MPSVTATLGWTLANWGPAPSTYTIAASCSQSSSIYIANTDLPSVPVWSETCTSHTIDECWPQPTDSALAEDALDNQYNVPYWSPGTQCPSGWRSVGAAAHPTNGPVTSSGIFTVHPERLDDDNDNDDDDYDDGIIFGSQDALGALLDSGETAIACCPSSMSVARNGICFSTLPSYSVTTACCADYRSIAHDLVSTTYMLNGTTRTGPVLIPATETFYLPTLTRTTTFNDRETSQLIAATTRGPIYYVHQESDSNSDSNSSTSTSSGSGSSSDNSETGSSETNAASRFYSRSGEDTHWGQIQAVAGVLAVSLVAGMALVMPW